MTKTLDVLKGTDYRVSVTRDPDDLSYVVKVTRPPRGDEREAFHVIYGLVPDEQELIGHVTMRGSASERDLERVVEDIISSDAPSLVGIYTAEEEED